MPSNDKPTKTSEPRSHEPSQALTEEQKARALETLKQIMPSVIAKPKPKKPIPRNVN